MSPAQNKHLRDIKYDFLNLLDAKYRKGAKEHGGTLQGMSREVLIDEAINEAIDQVVYLLTLKEKLNYPLDL